MPTLLALWKNLSRYECVYDIWLSIFWFRVARYAMHFGAAIITAGVLMVLWHVTHFTPHLSHDDMMLIGK